MMMSDMGYIMLKMLEINVDDVDGGVVDVGDDDGGDLKAVHLPCREKKHPSLGDHLNETSSNPQLKCWDFVPISGEGRGGLSQKHNFLSKLSKNIQSTQNSQNDLFLAFWGYQKWYFWCPNQNFKTTFQ